jgi:hypothetical protein
MEKGYRLYRLDTKGHILEPPMTVQCEDDETALEKAKRFLDERAIEVWHLSRRVGRLEPKS